MLCYPWLAFVPDPSPERRNWSLLKELPSSPHNHTSGFICYSSYPCTYLPSSHLLLEKRHSFITCTSHCICHDARTQPGIPKLFKLTNSVRKFKWAKKYQDQTHLLNETEHSINSPFLYTENRIHISNIKHILLNLNYVKVGLKF